MSNLWGNIPNYMIVALYRPPSDPLSVPLYQVIKRRFGLPHGNVGMIPVDFSVGAATPDSPPDAPVHDK